MGFRYRKSIRLGGGFRVNLSTKGIGYSWGVKGYTITKTADGRTRQTVSLPGTGISYVDEHGPHRGSSRTAAQVEPVDPYAGYTDVEQVKSADIDKLRSGAYEELFKQIKFANIVRIAAVILTALSSQVGMVFFYICVAACAALFILSRNYIEHEFDDVEQAKWNKLSAAWRAVASSQSLQEITASCKGETLEWTREGDYISVIVDDISAKDLDEYVTLTVSDGTETMEVSYSPMTYCRNVRNGNNPVHTPELKALAAALYVYNQAANIYFGDK